MTARTIPPDTTEHNSRVDMGFQVALYVIVAALVLASATGWIGVRTGVAAAQAEGYTLEVRHGRVTRSGLPTPLVVSVSRPRGLPEHLDIRIETEYLKLFDLHGIWPVPASTYAAGGITTWSFDVPRGSDEITITYDGRIEPAAQGPRTGMITLVVDGRVVASVTFRTWVVP